MNLPAQRPGPAQVQIALRRLLMVRPRGWQLDLDLVDGITRVRILDAAVPGVWIRRGVAVVEVVGGDRRSVVHALEAKESPHLAIVLVHREATARDKIGAWLRWHWWRLRFFRPHGVLPAGVWRRLPRWARADHPVPRGAARRPA